MRPPRYWRRGLLAGVVVWFIMSHLVSHLDTRNQKMVAEGNIEIPSATNSSSTKQDQQPRHRQTDFGRMMGVLIFALFCVIPENPVEVRPPGPKKPEGLLPVGSNQTNPDSKSEQV